MATHDLSELRVQAKFVNFPSNVLGKWHEVVAVLVSNRVYDLADT